MKTPKGMGIAAADEGLSAFGPQERPMTTGRPQGWA